VTEDEIKTEMRLYVLEVCLANLYALTVFANAPNAPKAAFEHMKQQMLAGARGQTFSGLRDPALSDLHSAELENAVARFASMVSEQINVVLAGRKN
jgi:hypothetical protein